jgi:hypothetical protein
MATELDLDEFRENRMFTQYSDPGTYTDTIINSAFATSKIYIEDNSCTFDDDQLSWVLQLMTAHLLYIQDQIIAGYNSVVVSSGTEGKVSVTLVDPPSSESFSYWLNVSPYGRQVLAMLAAASAGGFYVGGSPERKGFRKIGGGW